MTIPVHVNVVPADVAAGRVRDPKVVEESLFAAVQKRKKRSVQATRDGNLDAAQQHLMSARDLASSMPASPALQAELLWIDKTSDQLYSHGADHTSRRMTSNLSRTKRGSRARDIGGEIEQTDDGTDSPDDRTSGGAA